MNQLEHKQGNPKSPPTTDKFIQGSYHDHGDDNDNQQSKSVLSTVKERAKRWGQTLSKKRQGDDGTTTWGGSLDTDGEEDNAEFLGAPMYESELAPDELKETARQHPRAEPVISKKHVLANSVNPRARQDDNYNIPMPLSLEPCADQPARDKHSSPTSNKSITNTLSEKLAPAYAKVSDAITSKVKNLTFSPSSVASSAATMENTAAEEESHGRILQTN